MTGRSGGGGTLDLSVVIPARDAAGTLPAQLAALRSQDWSGSWEVIVVDNCSGDGTAAVVTGAAADWPRLRLVGAHDRAGPGHARNVGVREARAGAIALCDSDDVVAPGWVAAMGDALTEHAFVAGPIEIERLNAEWLSASRSSAYFAERTVFEGIFPFASGCNVGFTRRCWDLGGEFDDTYFPGEDLEWSMRLWHAGIDLHFCPAAVVHYRLRPTMAALFRQARKYGTVRPLLAERLRELGRAAPSRWAGARNWMWLLRHLPDLRTRTGRARWLWVTGQRIGNVQGGIRVRRLYL